MRPPDPPVSSGASAKPDEDEKDTVGITDGQGREQQTIIQSEPALTARTPAPGRAHLRVVQSKRGSKYG